MFGTSYNRWLLAGMLLAFLSAAPAWATVNVVFQEDRTVTTGTLKLSIPQTWIQAGHVYTITTTPVSGQTSAYGDPYIWSVMYQYGSSTRRVVYESRHTPDSGERAHLRKEWWDAGEDRAEFWVKCELSSCYMRMTVYERKAGTFDRKTFYREGVEPGVLDGQFSLYKDFYHPTEKNGDYGLQVNYEPDRYVYLHRNDNFSTSGTNALSLWIRSSGSIDENDLWITLTTGEHYTTTGWLPMSDYVNIAQSHTWYRAVIPLSDLNPSGNPVRGLAIRSDISGFVYLDDVELVSSTIPLLWPLEGGFPGGTITSPFGDDWVNSCNGLIKKHAGLDVAASVGTEVRSAMAGTVRDVYTDPQWGQAVVVEDETGSFTVVYWHIDASVSEGSPIKRGATVGTVADISPHGSHLHFGYRRGSYHSANSLAGALPQTLCGGYPAFPENFVNPATLSFDSW